MEDNKKPVEYEERNATLDADEVITDKLSESELQEKILEDSDMSGFQKFIARLDGAKWILAQRVFGVLVGLGASVALFWPGKDGKGGSFSLVIAVVIALLIPNIIEKRAGRKITQARFAMAITLCIAVVAFFIITGFKHNWQFIQK